MVGSIFGNFMWKYLQIYVELSELSGGAFAKESAGTTHNFEEGSKDISYYHISLL